MKRTVKTGAAILLALVMLMGLSTAAMADTTLQPDFIYYLDDDGAYPIYNDSYYVTLYLDHSMLGLLPGDRLQLNAYMEAPVGISALIRWGSSNPDVVSVNDEGRITAHRLGRADITASIASLKVTCRVHVTLDRMYYDDIDNHTSVSGYLSGQELWAAGHRPDPVGEDKLPLRTWHGNWNSIISYFDYETVADALDSLASTGNSSSFVEDYNSVFAMDFPAMRIEDDVITIYDATLPGGPALYAYQYRPINDDANYSIGGSGTDRAYIFRATNRNAPYRYLMLTAPQIYANYDTPIFFHIRYDNDLSQLMRYEDWAPVMVDASATPDQVAELLIQLAND